MCPAHMVLDEVTQRCVHVEDCEYYSLETHEITCLYIIITMALFFPPSHIRADAYYLRMCNISLDCIVTRANLPQCFDMFEVCL